MADLQPKSTGVSGTLQKPTPTTISKVNKFLRQNLLLVLTVGAVVIGFTVGISFRGLKPNKRIVTYVGFPGEMFMRMLSCVVVPLIMASMLTGVSRLNLKNSGRIGGITVLYYLATTIIAVVIGIVLVVIIHPGKEETSEKVASANITSTIVDTLFDLLRNMFPDNLIGSTIYKQKTCSENEKNILQECRDGPLRNIYGTNIIGIILCSIVFGIVLGQMGEKAQLMIDFFDLLDKVSMRIISWIMWYSPLGIASMITSKVLGVEDLGDTMSRLGLFCATVLAGLAIHILIVLPSIYFLFTRKNPLDFLKCMLQAMLIAFGTASSTATLPTTFRCLEEKLGIDSRITRFVLPIGATINMDGTALYEAVAAIFFAQMAGKTLNIGQIIVLSLTSTLASVGAAAIPSGSLVTMSMVLATIDIPPDNIKLLYAIDWFLDRFRTTINMLGDAYGAAIVHHHCRKYLSVRLMESNENNADKLARNDIHYSPETVATKESKDSSIGNEANGADDDEVMP